LRQIYKYSNFYRASRQYGIQGAIDTENDLSFEELCQLVTPVAKKYGSGNIYLFKSRARGDNSEESDYDFYIILGQIRGLKFYGLIRELEELLSKNVDVVTEGSNIDDDFSRKIHNEMRLVYDIIG